jgi:DNA-binding transcriptional LysR family regulator
MAKHMVSKPDDKVNAVPRRRQANAGAMAGTRQIRPSRVLIYVDGVARHGSIRKAAEALHVASSALNRRILDLEKDLGCDLFERLPRGVRPTAAGELFIDYVRRAISDLNTVTSRIEQLRGVVRGQIKIAAVESVAGDFLPRAITLFQSTHPRVRFEVTIGAPESLLQLLIEDQADLILTHTAISDRNVSIAVSTRWPFFALVASGHPLASKPEIRLRDCLRYPIALGDQTLAGRALIERALEKASFTIEPSLISNSVEAMKAFSLLNSGVCFQFRPPGTRTVEPSGMVAIPVTDPPLPSAQLLLATRRGRVLPFAAAAFVERLRSLLETP